MGGRLSQPHLVHLTSAATGESITYAGLFTPTQDFVAGTVTTTGLSRSTVIPGAGRLTLAAGREEVPVDASDVFGLRAITPGRVQRGRLPVTRLKAALARPSRLEEIHLLEPIPAVGPTYRDLRYRLPPNQPVEN